MREDDFRPVYCFKFIKINTTDCHKSRCQYEILTIEYEIGENETEGLQDKRPRWRLKMLKDLYDEGQH